MTTRTQGMGLLAFACVLGLSSMLQAEESPAERTVAILRQVQALAAAGQAEEADKLLDLSVEEFRTLVQAKPDDALVWIGLGGLQAAQRKFDDAEASLREAVRLQPQNRSAMSLLRTVLIDSERVDEAIPIFIQEIQVAPKDAKLRRQCAILLMATNRLDEAEAQARAAMQIDAKDPESIQVTAVVLSKRQKFDEAVDTLRAGIELNPQDITLRKTLVIILHDVKVYSEAYDELLEIRKLQPEDIDVEEKLILLAAKNRKSDWAEKHIARLRELRIAQKQSEESIWRDDFSVGKLRVVVEEYFEIKGDPGFKYAFLVYDQDQREQCRVVLFVSDEITKKVRKWGQLKDAEQAFVMAKQVGKELGKFQTYNTLPNYEQARRLAIELIESDEVPKVLLPLAPKPTAENAQQPAAK